MLNVGNKDSRVSRYKKCWIQDSNLNTICGIYGPGTSREITANWTQPFEGEMQGLTKIDGGIQTLTGFSGMTMVRTLNSTQVWQGNQPTAFTLELILYALEDPVQEVMLPLQLLEKMMAPDVALAGAPPNLIILNIGSKVIYKDVVINSMSLPFDKEVDLQGNFVRATTTLQLSTLTMVDKNMLNSGDYGFKA